MHELSIAVDICNVIEQTLGQAKPLEQVFVTVGPLSGITPEALEFCFSSVTQEMGFGNPALIINRTTVKIRCNACGSQYENDDLYSLCPECGSFDRDILSGSEFTVDSIEVKEETNV